MPGPPAADQLGFRRALEALLGIPATQGNQADVLRNGDRIFPAMFEAIEAATSTIDFLTFVYWEGSIGEELAELLAAKAKAGVRVRVILDALGALSMNRGLVERMSVAGAQVEWFRPVNKLKFWEANRRSHRKVLICDEDVAFTGGIGIADEWRGDARMPGGVAGHPLPGAGPGGGRAAGRLRAELGRDRAAPVRGSGRPVPGPAQRRPV